MSSFVETVMNIENLKSVDALTQFFYDDQIASLSVMGNKTERCQNVKKT